MRQTSILTNQFGRFFPDEVRDFLKISSPSEKKCRNVKHVMSDSLIRQITVAPRVSEHGVSELSMNAL